MSTTAEPPLDIKSLYSDYCKNMETYIMFRIAAAAGLTPRLVPEFRRGGDLDALVLEARAGTIDDVVIALPWSEDDRVMAIVSRLRELPVNVYLASDLIGFRTEFRSPPGHFGRLPVVQLIGRPMSGWDSVIKSIEDCALASVLVVALSPLLVLIALAIKLDSSGPVLFTMVGPRKRGRSRP